MFESNLKEQRVRVLTLLAFVCVAALTRLLPHPPNFTPIGAMALFAGAHFGSRWAAVAAPLSAMLISDLVLATTRGWAIGPMTMVIYACLAATSVLGVPLRERCTWPRIGLQSLFAALLFFVVTNFAVWAGSNMYSHDCPGLVACFVAALPFFGNTVASHIVFGIVMFGGFAALQRWVPALAAAGDRA